MSDIWGVTPDAMKIDLVYTTPDGEAHPFWISLRKQLTIGEDRKQTTAGWKSIKDGEMGVDWTVRSFARTKAYLVAWSLSDDAGKPIACDMEGIETRNADVYLLIEDAITAHVEAMAEEKKVTPTSRRLSAISA